ncbi:hypothetical protein [Microbulbifer sp. MI-G]|uniref:DMT family transporter n=1 Tax=Microbulbifer spongiae TaxID=2944933 RepID=A0ABY9E5Z4_9GAMM|nr:hypothetical protein [Microbulbifer sp. MI-G]WKD48448.1 DMT family transporter [Microbulbifer sp. MI-G]
MAQLAVLGATLSYAFAGVFGRRFKPQNINPIVITAGQVTASALFLAPIAMIADNPMDLEIPGKHGYWCISRFLNRSCVRGALHNIGISWRNRSTVRHIFNPCFRHFTGNNSTWRNTAQYSYGWYGGCHSGANHY